MIKINMFLSIAMMCFINTINAQSDSSQSVNRQDESRLLTSNDSAFVMFELTINPETTKAELDRKVFKNEIGNKSILITTDDYRLFLSIDTTMMNTDIVQDQLQKRDLLLIRHPPLPEEPDEKFDPEIDKFLNIEDSTIFTTEFLQLDLSEIHLSRRKYYEAIQIIHDFGKKIKTCEYNVSDLAIIELVKQKEISIDSARVLLLAQAKKDHNEAKNDVMTLIPYKNQLALLSPVQLAYYEKLKRKFNALSRKINPD